MLVKLLLLLNWITSCVVGGFIIIEIISSIKIYLQRKELIKELKKYNDNHLEFKNLCAKRPELQRLKPKVFYDPRENILPFKNPRKNNER